VAVLLNDVSRSVGIVDDFAVESLILSTSSSSSRPAGAVDPLALTDVLLPGRLGERELLWW
jgi:hypothetical protein